MNSHNLGESGRSLLEAIIGFLVIVALVPPIVSGVLYTLASFLGLAIPWLGVIALVAVAGACVAAVVASLPQARPADEPPAVPTPLPPAQRPPGIPRRRRDY